jgi:hypothetical protein
MKSLLYMMIPAIFAFTNVQAQNITGPDSPASAPILPQTQHNQSISEEAQATLRLSVTANTSEPNAVARIAGLAICSATKCIDVAAPSSVRLSTTEDGRSTDVAELSLPYMEVVRIRFKSYPGPSLIQGEVALPEPLRLTKDTPRGAVLVVVQSQGARLSLKSAAANYWNPEGTTFFYNPNYPALIRLPHGVKLTLPADATTAPQVFFVAVHDTGDTYPLVDIYPKVQLSKAGQIELPAISRLSGESSASGLQITPGQAGAKPLVMSITSTGTLRRRVQSSVGLEPSASATAELTDVDRAVVTSTTCNAAGWCDCQAQLAHPPNQQRISTSLATTGTVYLDWCTTIAPFVHITISNLSDSRVRMTLRHDNKIQNPDLILRSPLRRITDWSQNTQVVVNGFTWKGGKGIVSGEYGLPLGHVFDPLYGGLGTRLLGGNLNTGGACDDFIYVPVYSCNSNSPSGGNQRIMSWAQNGSNLVWRETALVGAIADLVNANRFYVSSSTSVVKEGVCSTLQTMDRWSAVGVTSTGRVIVLSTSAGSTASTAQLCNVFKSLGVNNAIRLDGGTAAGLTVDRALKNPLTGMDGLIIGASRYIAYGIAIGYPGAGATPSVESDGFRKIPPNPCAVNPRSCL